MQLINGKKFNILQLKLRGLKSVVLIANLSSNNVRKRFLDYFITENNHSFIRSSPIVPFCDKSVAFVNAGMNQFKGIFLGDLKRPCAKAANSQKCIRVGGKHNDLNVVGHDSYHHTFFEMLGNWSFGDYFKSTACELAWRLLTTPPFSLDPNRLYVTYFSGDEKLGLPPDIETKEIWKSIGVDPNHILQFGVKDNFWEMGPTGPCGPCTEIHYDHIGGMSGCDRVNKGFSDLTELWNIVFIQFNRNEDQSLSILPNHHVDTGMGFERLVALLQKKQSNYDTDLFTPLFNVISKTGKIRPYQGNFGNTDVEGIDTAYRILADHSRMLTIALADNMFPDNNHKLRRVLRKALLVSEQNFKMKKGAEMVKAVSNQVAEILSPTYPEIGNNLKKVHFMIDYENDLLKDLKESTVKEWQKLCKQDPRLLELTGYEAPGLPSGYKEILSNIDKESTVLSGELGFHLYDTYGLNTDIIEDLSDALGLEFDKKDFEVYLSKVKQQSKCTNGINSVQTLLKDDIKKLTQTLQITDDSFKYDYNREVKDKHKIYSMSQLDSTIKAVIFNGRLVDDTMVKIKPGDQIGIITNRTCFYSEAGGQESDIGTIVVLGTKAEQMFSVNITGVANFSGYIVHYGVVSSGGQSLQEYEIEIGNKAYLSVDTNHRVNNMRNHTATHLLNSALRKIFTVTCQKASKVSNDRLELEFSVFGETFSNTGISKIEDSIRQTIQSKVPVMRSTVSVTELLGMPDVNLLPGEVYPQDQIHLIQIVGKDLVSKEACCGTHVKNTEDIEEICLTNICSQGPGTKLVQAVTGQHAINALTRGAQESESISAMFEGIIKLMDKEALHGKQLEDLNEKIKIAEKNISGMNNIPYIIKCDLLQKIDEMTKKVKEVARSCLRKSMESEIREQLLSRESTPYLVHFLKCYSPLDSIPLQKATRLCPDIPVVIFALSEGQIKARCCVPEKWAKPGTTAADWMTPVLSFVGGSGGAPRGQDPRLVFNITSPKMQQDKLESVKEILVKTANKAAFELFRRK
uniref:Alanine--tRNA ligase n=2 Tax=Clastoptera arizonana TaxID=38151 RepID=A0A1B6D1Y3_9HEMI